MWADERNDSSFPVHFMGQKVQNVQKNKESIFLEMPEFQHSPYAVPSPPLAKRGGRTLYSKVLSGMSPTSLQRLVRRLRLAPF